MTTLELTLPLTEVKVTLNFYVLLVDAGYSVRTGRE